MKRIISVVLAVVMVLSTCLMVGCGSSKTPISNNNKPVSDVNTFDPDSVIVKTGHQSEIKLMSAAATEEEIATLGLTKEPAKTVTITASGTPADAMKYGVKWEVSWKNPSSTWASGKNVSSYVTYNTAESTTKITISLKEAFGEQIIVKAISLDDPSLTATCTFDYAQRVTGVTLNIGNIACIMNGGKTNVKYEVCPTATGDGGSVSCTLNKSSVYTITDTFSESITLNYVSESDRLQLGSSNQLTGTFVDKNAGKSIKGSSVYFDYKSDMKNWVFYPSGVGEVPFSELSTSDIIDILSTVSNKNIGKINITVIGSYSTYEDSTILYYNGYKNSTTLTQINFNHNGYVF